MKPLFIIGILSFVFSCGKVIPRNDKMMHLSEKERILKYRIKSIYVYSIYPGEKAERQQASFYDKKGNLTESYYDQFKQRNLFFYNDREKLIKMILFVGKSCPDTTIYYYNNSGSFIAKGYHSIEKYDSTGKELEEDNDWGKVSFKYDKKGNLLLREDSISSDSYRYDTDGHLVEEVNTIGGVDLSSGKQVYKYDRLGNNIEIDSYDPEFSEQWHLTNMSVRTYNEVGQLGSIRNLDSNKKVKQYSCYSYDNNGNDYVWFYYNNQGGLLSEKVYLYEYYKN